MRHFPLPALPLLACFTALTCMGAASALWTLHQFSPSNWLTVAVGQKFSPPADYFYTVRFWLWIQIGAMTGVAAVLAWRLHAAGNACAGAALAAASRMARGDLTAHPNSSGGTQNNKLLSTMQEMNTCISEIVAKARQQNDSLAGGASELARIGLQAMARSSEWSAALVQAGTAGDELGAAARRGADTAAQLAAAAQTGAAAAAHSAALAARIGHCMEAAGAGARSLAQLQGEIAVLARQGESLALSAALEAAHAGGDSVAVLAAEVRTLAERTGAAAHSLRQLTGQAQQQAAAGAALCIDTARLAEAAAGSTARAHALATTLAADAGTQQADARTLTQALAAADQARRRAAALTEQSAATAATVRDQAGALVRTLGSVTLAPQYGSSALIRLAHSSAAPALTAARGKRLRAAHLVSIL